MRELLAIREGSNGVLRFTEGIESATERKMQVGAQTVVEIDVTSGGLMQAPEQRVTDSGGRAQKGDARQSLVCCGTAVASGIPRMRS